MRSRPSTVKCQLSLTPTAVNVRSQLNVDNARAQGWSWQEIASALGVSRQADHKKHAAGRLLPRKG